MRSDAQLLAPALWAEAKTVAGFPLPAGVEMVQSLLPLALKAGAAETILWPLAF